MSQPKLSETRKFVRPRINWLTNFDSSARFWRNTQTSEEGGADGTARKSPAHMQGDLMRTVVDLVLKTVISAIFVVLVACVSWQVITRYILGTPSIVTDELARFLFMWLALIGGAYTMGLRRHLAIDLLTQRLRGTSRLISESFILLAIAGFAVMVMIKGGSQLVFKTFSSGQVTPALQIPMGYVYGAIPFAGAIILFYCVIFAIDLMRGGPDALDDPSAAKPVGGPLD